MISRTALMLAGIAASITTAGMVVAQTPPASADWREVAPENLLVIDSTKGRILVEMEPRAAPRHVERIQTLTNRGFYDGVKFHRVLPGFMAQTGDPQGTGEGGSDLPDVAGEFSFRRGRDAGFVAIPNSGPGLRGLVGSLPVVTQPDAQMMITADFKVDATGQFCPGVLGMARSSSPDSANSQFFLMMGPNESLNGGYTAFGRVLQGQDVVTSLNAGSDTNNGTVENPDVMTKVQLASAIPVGERPVVRVQTLNSPPFLQAIEAKRTERGGAFNLCDVQPAVEVVGGGS